MIIIRGSTDINIYINGINDGGTYSGSGGDIAYKRNQEWETLIILQSDL